MSVNLDGSVQSEHTLGNKDRVLIIFQKSLGHLGFAKISPKFVPWFWFYGNWVVQNVFFSFLASSIQQFVCEMHLCDGV